METGFVFHSQQGQHYEGRIGDRVAARQVDMAYMQVPLVLRYTFSSKHEEPSHRLGRWALGRSSAS